MKRDAELERDEQRWRDTARSLNLTLDELLELVEDEYYSYFTHRHNLRKNTWVCEAEKSRVQNAYWVLSGFVSQR